jgi:hypothetical protein
MRFREIEIEMGINMRCSKFGMSFAFELFQASLSAKG